MERYGLTRSMSAKGCSPDNAAAEGFFGRMKTDVLLQCLFDRFGSVFPQCGLMVFPGVVIVSR